MFDDLDITDGEILVIGAGGFASSAGEDHGNRFTYVDIDPEIDTIVDESMSHTINGEFIGTDGRAYLYQHTETAYDVIFLDAFSSAHLIPEHLVTREFFELASSRLAAHGLMVANIIGLPFQATGFFPNVLATMESVFGNCHQELSHFDPERPANIMILCVNTQSTRDETSAVYTDNLNRSGWDIALK